jgi:hypothetical protein
MVNARRCYTDDVPRVFPIFAISSLLAAVALNAGAHRHRPSPAPPVVGAARDQAAPAICGGRDGYFAAWLDDRNFGILSIYATRISSEGEVLDRSGIPVSTLPGDTYQPPRVAFSGSHWIVAWTGGTPGAPRLRTVSLDGQTLGEVKRMSKGSRVDVASDGNTVVAVAEFYDRLIAYVYTPDLSLLIAKHEFALNERPAEAAIVADADGYVVVYVDGNQTRSVHLDRSGNHEPSRAHLLGPLGFLPPRIARNGDRFLIISGTDLVTTAVLLDRDGVPIGEMMTLDSREPEVQTSGPYYYAADMTATDDGFLVTFPTLAGYERRNASKVRAQWLRASDEITTYDLAAVRVSLSGEFLSRTVVTNESGAQVEPAMAAFNGSIFGVWTDRSTLSSLGTRAYDIRGSKLWPDGALVTRTKIISAANPFTPPP